MTVVNNVCNYSLKHGLQYASDEVAAATIIQRAFRKWRFMQEASKGATSEQVARLYLKMKDWSEQGFARHPRVPLDSKSITAERCKQAMSKDLPELISAQNPIISPEVISHVSFEAFKVKLNAIVDEFLQHLMSLPEGERGYVIVVDEREKSNRWALSLSLDKLALLPPIDVIYKEDMARVSRNPHVKHIVFLDDASYSGSQIKDGVDQCSMHFLQMPQLKAVHILVPFLSSVAKKKILSVQEYEASVQDKIFFPRSSPISSVGELPVATKGSVKGSDVSQFAQQIASRYQGYDGHLSKDRVPLLHLFSFDHKIPDTLSVVTPLMQSLVGEIVPPYKPEFDEVLDNYSQELDAGLRVDLLPGNGLELSKAVVIVCKERTLYLATKTYLENKVAIQRINATISVLSCEMVPILPGDIVNVEGVGEFHFDGSKIFR